MQVEIFNFIKEKGRSASSDTTVSNSGASFVVDGPMIPPGHSAHHTVHVCECIIFS